MKRLRVIRTTGVVLAVGVVVLVLINLAFPLDFMRSKEAALSLAFILSAGVGNALLADRRLRVGTREES